MSSATYNAVMLPPTERFKTQDEGIRWVRDTFAKLKAPLPGKAANETALSLAMTNAKHLTIVLTPEFAFNGYLESGATSLWFDAKEPLDPNIEKAVRAEIQNQLQALKPQGRILFTTSCVLDTGRVNQNKKKIGCNRICIMSSSSTAVQFVYKLKIADIPSLIISGDGWEFGQWVVTDGWREFDNETRKGSNPRLGTEGRLAECTYVINDFTVGGQPVAIGFGTCVDSRIESYSGTNIIAFCGGNTQEANIQDSFHQNPLDPSSVMIGHQGYLINDTTAWADMQAEPAGYRQWNSTTPSSARTANKVPNYAEVTLNAPNTNKPKRALVVTAPREIPSRPATPQLNLYAMLHSLSRDDHDALVNILQAQSLAVNEIDNTPPASVLDALRLYNDARYHPGPNVKFKAIPAVDNMLKQSDPQYPQKPLSEGVWAWKPTWCTLL
ncbi:hypothetical protein V5O48_004846 [Marasmius crinis-equi]|uniref:Uncharacterized protein n=1 Tax=Marasmius crinis-equi TaxID=585013 RepID=A0ABR3FPN4_9AGAR